MFTKLLKDFDKVKALLTTLMNESQQFKVMNNNDTSAFATAGSSSSSSYDSTSSSVFNRLGGNTTTATSSSTNGIYMDNVTDGDINNRHSELESSHQSLEMKLIPSLQGNY